LFKITNKIKAVIFDVGGVLRINRYKGYYSGTHEYIADKLGMSLDAWFDAIDKTYADSIVGKVSRDDFLRVISKKLNVSKRRLVSLTRQSYDKRMKKNNKLFKFAFDLKDRGYILGILSDQWALSTENLIPAEDRKGFDVVIISSEDKLRKPDFRVYRYLYKKLKRIDKTMKYSEILFVDNRDYNLEAAKKLGIQTILFEDNKKFFEIIKKYKL
jgi:epoxide hydrolase-like predicted phosphatase